METNRSRLAPDDIKGVCLKPRVWRFAVYHLFTSMLSWVLLFGATGFAALRLDWGYRSRGTEIRPRSRIPGPCRELGHDANWPVLGFHSWHSRDCDKNSLIPSARVGNNTPANRSWLPPLQPGLTSCLSRLFLSPDLLSENVERMHLISARPMRHSNQAITLAMSTGLPGARRFQATAFCQRMRGSMLPTLRLHSRRLT